MKSEDKLENATIASEPNSLKESKKIRFSHKFLRRFHKNKEFSVGYERPFIDTVYNKNEQLPGKHVQCRIKKVFQERDKPTSFESYHRSAMNQKMIFLKKEK